MYALSFSFTLINNSSQAFQMPLEVSVLLINIPNPSSTLLLNIYSFAYEVIKSVSRSPPQFLQASTMHTSHSSRFLLYQASSNSLSNLTRHNLLFCEVLSPSSTVVYLPPHLFHPLSCLQYCVTNI